MTEYKNELGQAVGAPISDWRAATWPRDIPMVGKSCRLEAFSAQKHIDDLYLAFIKDAAGGNWTYMPYGPFDSKEAFAEWALSTCVAQDPKFYTIIDCKTDKPVGMASYLRIDPNVGSIEVGHIHFSPLLQGTTLATEAMYLMMNQVFDVWGYRRYEWKCDSLNAPSNKAALRFGFSFEGIFRQATMYKGRNRNTAWYSILDSEWAANKAVFEQWLSGENLDGAGRQLKALASFRLG
ncbi:MAG: RimJ/RimL family protein N-acetyltransferase [Saprospiraceae bacterium]|jgi:RimJ/RimL family protein N-acetyltransferase